MKSDLEEITIGGNIVSSVAACSQGTRTFEPTTPSHISTRYCVVDCCWIFRLCRLLLSGIDLLMTPKATRAYEPTPRIDGYLSNMFLQPPCVAYAGSYKVR